MTCCLLCSWTWITQSWKMLAGSVWRKSCRPCRWRLRPGEATRPPSGFHPNTPSPTASSQSGRSSSENNMQLSDQSVDMLLKSGNHPQFRGSSLSSLKVWMKVETQTWIFASHTVNLSESQLQSSCQIFLTSSLMCSLWLLQQIQTEGSCDRRL